MDTVSEKLLQMQNYVLTSRNLSFLYYLIQRYVKGSFIFELICILFFSLLVSSLIIHFDFRRPKQTLKVTEDTGEAFDPMKYIKY